MRIEEVDWVETGRVKSGCGCANFSLKSTTTGLHLHLTEPAAAKPALKRSCLHVTDVQVEIGVSESKEKKRM